MADISNTRPNETRVQRLQRLRRAVESSGTLHLKDAAELLKVSEMTVRRDLAGPEATLALLGGYVVNAASPTGIKYTFEQEIDLYELLEELWIQHRVHAEGRDDCFENHVPPDTRV